MKLHFSENEKILIVAPHPDDEVIGAGGILLNYGAQCDVLLLTDGRYGHNKDTSDWDSIGIRKNEFQHVMELLGVRRFFQLNICDKKVCENRVAISRFDIGEYDAVFVPNKEENHIDHQFAYFWFEDMKYSKGFKAKMFEYEVWSPLSTFSHYMDISSIIDKKTELLKNYQSQLRIADYCQCILGLSAYRGFLNSVEYAEVYREVVFAPFILRVWRCIPTARRIRIRNAIDKFLFWR